MTRSRRLVSVALAPVVALVCLSGCGSPSDPVAGLELGSQRIELPHRRYVPLHFDWRVTGPLDGLVGEPYVFVHLLDAPGNVVRTFDHPWPAAWRRGARVDYDIRLYQSALGPPLEPGTYRLTVGVYDLEGHRWPIRAAGEEVDEFEYHVADVRVPPEAGTDPMFQFSPAWLDSEAGRTRQVLARRWLTDDGNLLVSGLLQPGTLWLRLWLPVADSEQELVLEEGSAQQSALVRSDCGVEARLDGPGRHDVELPLAHGDPDGAACTVEVLPDFYLLRLDSMERRTLSLEVLAWAPGG